MCLYAPRTKKSSAPSENNVQAKVYINVICYMSQRK